VAATNHAREHVCRGRVAENGERGGAGGGAGDSMDGGVYVNWISFVVAVVPTTAALIYRIQVEEQALQEAFGEEYAQYSQVTKRLVPGVY
jgi:hypothetical protein